MFKIIVDVVTKYKKIAGMVGSITAICGLYVAFMQIDAMYARADDIKKIEQTTALTIQQVYDNMDLRMMIEQEKRLDHQINQTQRALRRNPNDEELKEDLSDFKQERLTIRNEIDNKVLKQQGKK